MKGVSAPAESTMMFQPSTFDSPAVTTRRRPSAIIDPGAVTADRVSCSPRLPSIEVRIRTDLPSRDAT